MTPSSPTRRMVKRYSNRKLYDLTNSRYVTLQDIAGFLQEGIEVCIVDNRSGQDITSVTLAQVLLEQERRQTGGLPLGMLRNILTSGGDLIQRKLATPVMVMKGEAEKNLHALREETERRVATIRSQAERSLHKWLDSSKEMGEEARSAFLEITHNTQVALDDLSRQFDERVRALMRMNSQGPRADGDQESDTLAGETGEAITEQQRDTPTVTLEALERRVRALEALERRVSALERRCAKNKAKKPVKKIPAPTDPPVS